MFIQNLAGDIDTDMMGGPGDRIMKRANKHMAKYARKRRKKRLKNVHAQIKAAQAGAGYKANFGPGIKMKYDPRAGRYASELMGGKVGRILAAIATGGGSEVARKAKKIGAKRVIGALATGGLSEAARSKTKAGRILSAIATGGTSEMLRKTREMGAKRVLGALATGGLSEAARSKTKAGRILSAIATGGTSEALRKAREMGAKRVIGALATGGMSEAARRAKAKGWNAGRVIAAAATSGLSEVARKRGIKPGQLAAMALTAPILGPAGFMIPKIAKAIQARREKQAAAIKAAAAAAPGAQAPEYEEQTAARPGSLTVSPSGKIDEDGPAPALEEAPESAQEQDETPAAEAPKKSPAAALGITAALAAMPFLFGGKR